MAPWSRIRLPFAEPPARICLLRLSAIGDVTHMVPVVASLRAAWPRTEITWCIGRREHGLLEGLAGVRFAILDKRQGWAGYRKLWAEAGKDRYDALVLAQLSSRANVASTGLKSDLRLGFDRQRARELHGLFVNARIPVTERQHVLDGFFSFAETLGVTERRLEWDIPVSDEDETIARWAVGDADRLLLINPCGSHPLRNWLPDRYAAVADHAIEQHGFRVAISGGPTRTDLLMGETVRRHMRNPSIDLVGKTTLKQLFAVLKRSTLVLSPDSGPAHMGVAAGAAVIALHAASNSGRTGPYLGREWTVDRYDQAARKYLGRPAADLPWGTRILQPGVMELITVEDVVERLDAFVAAGCPSPTRDENAFPRKRIEA